MLKVLRIDGAPRRVCYISRIFGRQRTTTFSEFIKDCSLLITVDLARLGINIDFEYSMPTRRSTHSINQHRTSTLPAVCVKL